MPLSLSDVVTDRYFGRTIISLWTQLQFDGYGIVSFRIMGTWTYPLYHVFIFSCDQAAIWLVQSVCLSVCPSVCLSVCPSVRPSHLFHHVPIIVSSWNFQELLPMTKMTSMQKVKVRGQRSRSQRSTPNLTVPDCNSSLNSHMMMKWCI